MAEGKNKNTKPIKDLRERGISENPAIEAAVRAGAGSGKTTALKNRYLNIINSGAAYTDEIVAITFTEAGAAEIKKKIIEDGLRQNIKDIREGKPKEKSLQFYMQQLEYIKKARISTIHSFCYDILKQYAPQFGYDVNLSVLEESAEQEVLDEAISRFIIEYLDEYGLDDSYLKDILLLAESEAKLRNIIKYVFNHRYQFERWLEFSAKFEKADIANSIRAAVNLPELKTQAALGAMSFKELSAYYMEINNVQKNPRGAKTQEALIDKTLNSAPYKEQQLIQRVYPALNHFMSRMIYYFAEWKMKNNFIDFLDMELRVVNALSASENKYILDKIAGSIKFLMVDEFQDTSEIQRRLLNLLLKDKRTNLFVVGDEKQSIYYFREADVSIFNEMLNDFSAVAPEGQVLNFYTNFRSDEKIIDFINTIFDDIFREAHSSDEASFYSGYAAAPQDLEAYYKSKKPHNRPVEILRLDPIEPGNNIVTYRKEESDEKLLITLRDGKMNAEFRAEYEAEVIARRILKLIQNGEVDNPGDIALLIRRRTHLEKYIKRLGFYGIKTIAYDSGYFYKNEIVKMLLNLVFFLNNYTDDVAFAGVLRSFFFGVKDKDFLLFRKENGNTLWSQFAEYVKNNENNEYAGIYKMLQQWLGYAKKSSIYSLISKIYADLDIFSLIQAMEDPEQEEANLKKFLGDALEFENTGYQSLESFSRMLKGKMAEGVGEEALVKSKNIKGYVKIMTVHAAKGLEFPVVILADMYKNLPSSFSSKVSFFKSEKESQIVMNVKLPVIDKNGSTVFQRIKHINTRLENLEAKRLFYVALTRAKDKLIIPFLDEDGLLGGLTQPDDNAGPGTAVKRQSFFDIFSSALKNPAIITYIKGRGLLVSDETLYDTPTKIARDAGAAGTLQKKYIASPQISVSTVELNITDLVTIDKCENTFLFKTLYGISEGSLFQNISGTRQNETGNVVHKVMEIIEDFDELRSDKIDGIISRAERQLSIKLRDKERDAVRDNLKHAYFFSEMRDLFEKSARIHREMSIAFKRRDFIIKGVIDALFVQDSTAVILDYKTGKSQSYYPLQLKVYAYAIASKFRELNKIDAYLFYTAVPKIEKVGSFDRAALDNIMSMYDSKLDKMRKLFTHRKILPLYDETNADCNSCTLKYLCRSMSGG